MQLGELKSDSTSEDESGPCFSSPEIGKAVPSVEKGIYSCMGAVLSKYSVLASPKIVGPLKIKKEPMFEKDEYRPNNPVSRLQQYDKRRLRAQPPKRHYNTTDLKMPELLNEHGEVDGPTTKEIIQREISARQATNDNDTTDTASEGEEPFNAVDHVVCLFEPGVQVVGRKKVMYCHGSTSDFSAGFSFSVFTDLMSRPTEVSCPNKLLLIYVLQPELDLTTGSAKKKCLINLYRMIEPLFCQGNEPLSARVEQDIRILVDTNYPEFGRVRATLSPLLSERDCTKVQQIIAEYSSGAGALRSYVNLEI